MRVLVPVVAILAITVLDIVALSRGIDGQLMVGAVGVIAAIAGAGAREIWGRRKHGPD